MSKAVEGAVLLGGALVAGAFTLGVGGVALEAAFNSASWIGNAIIAAGLSGASMEAGAIAGALTSNRGMNITTRQTAAARQIIYGQQRVGGVEIYRSTTGSKHDQFNFVIVLAGHECDSIVNLYLDGRQVHFVQGGVGNVTRNGVNFGGSADSNTYTGPNGVQYNFGGAVYCEAKYGDQLPGDVIGGLTANDPKWAATEAGSPWVGGCTYVYLKIDYNTNLFPGEPEVRFTVNGKNNIWDPRSQTRGFTSNWALICADVLLDPLFGIGDNAAALVINGGFEVGDVGWSSKAPGFSIGTNPTYHSPGGTGTWAGIHNPDAIAPTGAMRSDTRVPVTPGTFVSAQGWIYKNSADPASGTGAVRIEFLDANGTEVRYVDGTALESDQSGVWVLSSSAGMAPAGAVYASVSCVVYDSSTGTYLFNAIKFLQPYASINEAQLIAAANICDEQVPLAISLTESRYTTNYHYDCATSPGDALSVMMVGAAGRLSRIGGEWFIWPAYYQGPSFSFNKGNIVGTNWAWESNREQVDLFNRVTGTYIAPTYPYNIAGNLYDQNGFYNGEIQNNFSFAYQPTSYPAYAVDTLHGYASDDLLSRDMRVPRPRDLQFLSVLSVAQAQRVAKINLLRNAQQGSGTFQMSLDAWRMQPMDVFEFTFPTMGWVNKLMEVTAVNFRVEDSGSGVPSVQVYVSCQETDPNIYNWDVIEELTVYDVPAVPSQTPYDPAPPTEMTLISSVATELKGSDGISRPRIEVTWNSPLDILTKQIQIQYQLTTALNWIDAGSVDISLNVAYIAGVIGGQVYDVRIRSVRANGAVSEWLEETGYTVSTSTTSIGTVYLNPNSPFNVTNTAVVDSIVENGAATVRVNGPGGDLSSFQYLVGAAVFIIPGAHITGLAFSTSYYVIYVTSFYDPQTLTIGGLLTATQNYNDTLLDTNLLICSVTTCASTFAGSGGSGGGGTQPGNPRGGPIEADNPAEQ
jgi:hypothetical protein